MVEIVGIAGSLRRGSWNAALLHAATESAPVGSRIAVHGIGGIPLYDGDLEADSGIPPAVRALQQSIVAADALLLVTPEYNNSIPGVLKNAIDWASRPGEAKLRVFRDKPVGLIGVTPGRFGTAFAQAAWLPVLRSLGARPWFGKSLYVGGGGALFDSEDRLDDEATRERLRDYLEAFVGFVVDTGRR